MSVCVVTPNGATKTYQNADGYYVDSFGDGNGLVLVVTQEEVEVATYRDWSWAYSS
jgi:hypothetical protein